MDRFEAMNVLLKVVEEGSLSACARKLNSSLPTISRKISDLERHLGTQLLMRTARRVELTEAGAAFVHASRLIMERVDEAERAAAGEYVAPRGELVITAPVLFGQQHVLPVAAAFLADHPDITLRFCFSDTNLSIAEEHVHLAIRIGELTDSSMIATRIGAVHRTVCASPAYLERRGTPVVPGDLAEHEIIAVSGFAEALEWSFVHDSSEISIPLKPRLVVNMPSTALEAAVSGMGIVRLLSYQVANPLQDGRLVSLLPDFGSATIPVSLAYPSQGLMPAKLRAFLDWSAPRLRARLGEVG